MDFTAIIEAGQRLGEPKTIGDGAYALLPPETKIEDLERFEPTPRRARANVVAADVPTFCSYLARFIGPATVIFADPNPASFAIEGILDYHTASTPGHRGHRVNYTAPKANEWVVWRHSSGRKMDQASFAQFIEDNQIDIVFPVGAEILEISRSLSAHKSVEFVSSVSLADGSRQLTYNETVEGATARGNIKVPDEFILGIPVFFGGEKYEVRARLRYRIEQGKLALWYDLYRPEYIEQDAFASITNRIGETTGVPVWLGRP